MQINNLPPFPLQVNIKGTLTYVHNTEEYIKAVSNIEEELQETKKQLKEKLKTTRRAIREAKNIKKELMDDTEGEGKI